MNFYEQYLAINKKLACGERVLYSQREGNHSHESGNNNKILHYPRIGIYTGTGASHSWLWFVEIFERVCFYDLSFLDEDDIKNGKMNEIDVLAMSGGDTFSIAKALGARGSEKIQSFIREGGLYIGSCAGAYLPLNSSKTYLNLFNYVNAKITNLTRTLPVAKTNSEKFCTPYGCSFIFHPVREAVRLTPIEVIPFKGVGSLLAPLYGGPPMVASDQTEVLAYYSDFTDKTIFLVDESLARDTLLGKAAVVRKKMGEGHIYLFGPHFEHPHFPLANKLLVDVIYWDSRKISLPNGYVPRDHMVVQGADLKRLIRIIKREISNSRIVAVGLETMPVNWLIGKKVYEPAKIREFLEAIWTRIKCLENANQIIISAGKDDLLTQSVLEITSLLRDIKKEIDNEMAGIESANRLFKLLNKTSKLFLEIYFRSNMVYFSSPRVYSEVMN